MKKTAVVAEKVSEFKLLKSRLVVFGDSWPAGFGLKNPGEESFPELLGKQLNARVLNLSQCATSINHAVWNLFEFLKDRDDQYQDKILFCLTGKIRHWHFDKGVACEIHPTNTDIVSKAYYSYIYSDELGHIEWIKNIILIQEICRQHLLPVYFVSNWDNLPDHPMIDLNNFYSKSLLNLFGFENISEEKFTNSHMNNIYMTNIHPNVAGHKLIADSLGNWIINK